MPRRRSASELLTDPGFVAALRSGTTRRRSRASVAAARRKGLEVLTIVTPDGEVLETGAGELFAAATVRTTGRGGEYELMARSPGRRSTWRRSAA